MTGADLPRVAGAPPGKVLAYRYLNQTWTQVPVQVDERAMIDLGTVYNQARERGPRPHLHGPQHVRRRGPRPDARRERRDRVHGDRRRRQGAGGTRTRRTWCRARARRSACTTRSAIPPTPISTCTGRPATSIPARAAATSTYHFNLLSGDYKTTYKLNTGPNPEDSTVTTPFYTQHFSDRWADDALQITDRGASGVDILDRHKDLFAPGNCGRSEDTFDDAEGAFIVNKSGPVRAIRSYIGANSGPLTERQHIFYERREDITTYPARPRDPGRPRLLRLQPGGERDDLPSSAARRRRDDRRRARQPSRRDRSPGRRSTERRAASRSSTRSRPTCPA